MVIYSVNGYQDAHYLCLKKINNYKDYLVQSVPGSPLFEDVEVEDMVFNKGVAGFFARGYYHAPENAEVCLIFTDGKAISYIDRQTTNGTIIVHAGQNLLGYKSSKNTTNKIKKFVNLLIVVR